MQYAAPFLRLNIKVARQSTAAHLLHSLTKSNFSCKNIKNIVQTPLYCGVFIILKLFENNK